MKTVWAFALSVAAALGRSAGSVAARVRGSGFRLALRTGRIGGMVARSVLARSLLVGLALTTTTVAVRAAIDLQSSPVVAASVVSGGTMSGEMAINEDATMTLVPAVSVDSTVTNAVDMRIGPPVERIVVTGQSVFGLIGNGDIYGWGFSGNGQLGAGSAGTYAQPTPVGAGSQWTTVSPGPSATAFIRSDGALFMAGYNASGQLGDGTTTQRNSPVPVSAGSTWTAVSPGSEHTLGIKGDGSLWAWGGNTYGQLGQGVTGGTYYTPTRIGTATDWTAVDAGSYYSLALKSDGTLWAWGYNVGNLGLNDSTNRSVPVQVTPGQTYKAIQAGTSAFRTFAIRSDGTLWGWGSSSAGVGDGTTNTRLTPVQISVGTTFKEIAGRSGHVLAVSTDGALWAWGYESQGELGIGAGSTTQLSPVRVGTDTGWSDIAAGTWTSFGRRNGTLYSWGDKQGTMLGDATSRSTPGTMTTNWSPYSAHTPWTLGSADGTHTVWVSYRDAGGATTVSSDTIGADFTVPSGTMSLNAGTPASNSPTMAVCSQIAGAIDMSIDGGAWQPYAQVVHSRLSNGDGPRSVTVTYRDEFGRTSSLVDSITLDTAPPTGTVNLNAGAGSTRFTKLLSASAVDATSMGLAGRPGFTKVVSTTYHTMGIRTDGSLWGAGGGGWGVLGDSTSVAFRSNFVPSAQIGQTWKDVATGGTCTIAVANDGTLWGWGSLSQGFGDGYTYHPVPTKIDAATDWSKVWASGSTAAALKTSGALYMWGSNGDGQLGDGTQTNRATRVRVGAATDYFKDVSVGIWSTQAIKTDGSLWGWGYNGAGNLGIGNTTTPQKSPVRSGTETGWAQVACGSNSGGAIKTDGTLWTWGQNNQGTLGDGSPSAGRTTPARVGADTNWKQLSIQNGNAIALRLDGTIWGWGYNSNGQAGDGSMFVRQTPFKIGTDTDWQSVQVTSQHSMAIKTDGSLWAWGYNSNASQFGDGTTAVSAVYPIRCDFETYSPNTTVTVSSGDGTKTVSVMFRDAAGNTSVLSDDIALDTSGSPGAVSVNGGASYSSSAVVTVTSDVAWATGARFAAPARAIASGSKATMWIGEDGLVNGSGDYSYGTFGDGQAGFTTVPKAIFGSRGWSKIFGGDMYTFAIKNSTELWSTGYNFYGTLGDGTTTNRSTPSLVAGAWKQVSAGSISAAGVQVDGTLWTWGSNGSGQLGLGNYSNQTTPTKVGSVTTWKQVSSSRAGSFMLAVRDDGSLWAWGDNFYGQLGMGDKSGRTSPIRVGTANDWTDVAAGGTHSVALKSDGSLWAWGRTNVGQAGRSDITTEVLTPFRIGMGFSEIAAGSSHSIARKSDGTIWTWGDNTVGQLGIGDTTMRREPVRVGTGTDWAYVSAGGNNCSAVKTDGTVWAWGAGGQGQLGQSNSSNQMSPVMLGPAWGAYVATKSLTVEYPTGPARVYGQYRDIAGNVVSLYDDITFDTSPPSTTASGAPVGWSTTTPVTLTLSATDDYTGVSATSVSIDGSPAVAYSGPIAISKQGTTTVAYASRDGAGNIESTKTVTLRIDVDAPATTTDASDVWTNDPTVTFAATDVVSGLRGIYFRLNGSLTTTYTSPLSLSDGVNDVRYWSVDVAGNVEASHTVLAKIDRVAPVSSTSTIPAGWTSSEVTVTLAATDDRSGVDAVRHSLDSGAETTFSAPFSVGNGVHELTWRAVDAAGNLEDLHTATIRVDTSEPHTSNDFDGLWHRVPVTIGLLGTDGESGVSSTDYRLDGGPATPYAGLIPLSAEGTTIVEYWSTDAVGNVEQTHALPVRLDYTPPSTNATGVPAGVAPGDVSVVLDADDGASGVSATLYRVGGGEVRPYTADQRAIVVGKDGTTTVEYWSTDVAGNIEATHSVTVRISRAVGGSAVGAKNAACLECHASASMPGQPLGFGVADVDRSTACPSCHFAGLALSHPYHNSGGNCGVCHIGWGPSSLTAVPSVVTTAGAFMSSSSKDVEAVVLHTIHSSPRWEQSVSTASSACGSCHAAAACEACHTGRATPEHAAHSGQGSPTYPSRAPVNVKVGYGVPAGMQTVNSVAAESRQCLNAECHDMARLTAAGPVPREDFSHGVLGTLPPNTVVKTGTWMSQSGGGYTQGLRSVSRDANARLSIAFTGTRVAFVADKAPNLGIVRVSIDGSVCATLDQYSSTTRSQQVLWTSATLPSQNHTITISPTGTKNPAATTTYVSVDQFKTWNDPPPSVAPYCQTTCHADRVASHGYSDIDHVADAGAAIEPLSGSTCVSCHSMDLMTEHERMGSSPRGKGCLTCHGDPRKTFATWNQGCSQAACHTPGTTQAIHGALPAAHDVSSPVRSGCTRNCHEASVPAAHAVRGATTSSNCVTCHNSADFASKVRPTGWNDDCEQCHSTNHSNESATGNDVCFDCHGSSPATITAVAGPGAYPGTGGDHRSGYDASAHGSRVSAGANGGVDSGIQCEVCHNHVAITGGQRTDYRVDSSASTDAQSELCFRCHSATASETLSTGSAPYSWNGRDVAAEFSRPSAHSVVSDPDTPTATTRTVTAMLQNTPQEFSADGIYQGTADSTGAALLWGTYSNDPVTKHLLFYMPGTNRSSGPGFSQYDSEVDRWNYWGLDPADSSAANSWIGHTAAVVDNSFVWSTGYGTATRQRFTPGPAGTGSWASISNLPFTSGYNVDAAVDSARGLVYYVNYDHSLRDGTVYRWRSADDTWTGSFRPLWPTSGAAVSDDMNTAVAYSPETDRLYYFPKVKSGAEPEGHLYYIQSPATASADATMVDTGVQLSGWWGSGSWPNTRIERFTRAGQDYLLYVGHTLDVNTDPGNFVRVIGNLTGAHQKVELGRWPFGAYTGEQLDLAWDGGDYIYLVARGWPQKFVRIRIPADPLNDTWPAWETPMTPPLVDQYSATMSFLDAETPLQTVTGYRLLGRLSTEVDLPKGATGWESLSWTEVEPYATAIETKIEGWNGNAWIGIPGLSSLKTSPVDLSGIDAGVFTRLRLTATMTTVDVNATPRLKDWRVTAAVPTQDDELKAALTCANCHNTHLVASGGSDQWDTARFSDPRNTRGVPANTTDFCLSCHDREAVTRSLTASTVVPYSVNFAGFSGSSFFPGWDKGGATGFESSGHYTTTGTKALCENCHDPHGSQNPSLLAWTRPVGFSGGVAGARDNTSTAAREENLCLQCHGNGVLGRQAPGAQDVASALAANYGHDMTVTGAHSDTETAAGLNATRHAECVDCHDPHAARKGERVVGSAVAPPALMGATGMKPVYDGQPWTSATGYDSVKLNGQEGQVEALVCFKCHAAPSRTVTRRNASTYTATDLTRDFNPANPSYHNVLGLDVGMRSTFTMDGTTFSWGLLPESQMFQPGWTYNSPVTCSDCHTSGSSAQALGPHGATTPYMIDPAYPDDWRYSSISLTSPTKVSGNIICLKCHVFPQVEGTVHWARGIYGAVGHVGDWCTSCHISIPHGWKRPRMLGFAADPAPYRTNSWHGGGSALKTVRMTSHSATQWSGTQCRTGCSGYTSGHYDPWPADAMP